MGTLVADASVCPVGVTDADLLRVRLALLLREVLGLRILALRCLLLEPRVFATVELVRFLELGVLPRRCVDISRIWLEPGLELRGDKGSDEEARRVDEARFLLKPRLGLLGDEGSTDDVRLDDEARLLVALGL